MLLTAEPMKGQLVLPHSVLDPKAVSGKSRGPKGVWLEHHFEASSFLEDSKYLIQLESQY